MASEQHPSADHDSYAWVVPIAEIADLDDDDMTKEQYLLADSFVPEQEVDDFSSASARLSFYLDPFVRAKVAETFQGECGLNEIEEVLRPMSLDQQLGVIIKLPPEKKAGLYELGLRKINPEQEK